MYDNEEEANKDAYPNNWIYYFKMYLEQRKQHEDEKQE